MITVLHEKQSENTNVHIVFAGLGFSVHYAPQFLVLSAPQKPLASEDVFTADSFSFRT